MIERNGEGGGLEDGDIKMIISPYKAVNYKVIIN